MKLYLTIAVIALVVIYLNNKIDFLYNLTKRV